MLRKKLNEALASEAHFMILAKTLDTKYYYFWVST